MTPCPFSPMKTYERARRDITRAGDAVRGAEYKWIRFGAKLDRFLVISEDDNESAWDYYHTMLLETQQAAKELGDAGREFIKADRRYHIVMDGLSARMEKASGASKRPHQSPPRARVLKQGALSGDPSFKRSIKG